MHENLFDVLNKIFNSESLILAILSSPLEKQAIKKVIIRPLMLKNSIVYQLTEQNLSQAIHYNLSKETCLNWLHDNLKSYKQTFFYSQSADYQILVNRKGHLKVLTKHASKSSKPLIHNRIKHYALEEGKPIPFMVDLGLMTNQGKIISQKSDKFKQINRFLELVDDVLPYLEPDRLIQIVDFGCGKAYLTFALHYYLKYIKNLNVNILGLDLKEDVIAYCQNLSEKLGYAKELNFRLGNIHSFQNEQELDVVIALHACDTATDAAIEKAVKWQSKIILCAPCCQNEFYNQIQNDTLAPLLKYGILKERFAALATDALRAQLLEVLGYQTQVLEFIDMEHTPKNLLIRAVKNSKNQQVNRKWQAYLDMKEALHLQPSLEKFLQTELSQAITENVH